jgi:hypothetical protein
VNEPEPKLTADQLRQLMGLPTSDELAADPESKFSYDYPAAGSIYVPSWETPDVFVPMTIPPDAKRFVFVLKGQIVHQDDNKDTALRWAAVNGGFYDRMIDREAKINKYVKTEVARDHHKEAAERVFAESDGPVLPHVIGPEHLDVPFDALAVHAQATADAATADRMRKFAQAAEQEAGCPVAAGYWTPPGGPANSIPTPSAINDACRAIEEAARPDITRIMTSRDVLVRTLIQEWQLGGYPSFEAAMTALAAELLDALNQTRSELYKLLEGKT